MLSPRWYERGYIITCWDTLCDLDGMGGLWSTQVEIYFMCWYFRDLVNTSFCPRNYVMYFYQLKMRCILCSRWHGTMFWSTQVEKHFVSSLALERLGQYKLRYTLCLCRHGRGLVKTCRDIFCVLAGVGWVRSTHVKMHFVSSLSWDVYGQHILRQIFCPH